MGMSVCIIILNIFFLIIYFNLYIYFNYFILDLNQLTIYLQILKQLKLLYQN